MTKSEELEGQIAEAVLIREHGEPLKAAALLEGIQIVAAGRQDHANWARALAQRIVCHQLISNFGRDHNQLYLMEDLALEGMGFVMNHPAASDFLRIFEYRYAIALLRLGATRMAAEYFEKAARELLSTDSKYPEFISYLGLALVIDGKRAGIARIEEAARILDRSEPTPQDVSARHTWLVHRSGVRARMAEAYSRIGEREQTQAELRAMKHLAQELRDMHDNPWRWQEYHYLNNKLIAA